MQMVPVVSTTGKPLMPCPPARARELVRKGKALRRFKAGIFYIQLTQREEGELQKLKDRLSVHSIATGKRLSQNVKPEDCQFLTYNSWRTRWA